jgi:hypothetical protein
MYKIEKGIDIPKSTNNGKRGNPRRYPFDKMEIGDSFFVESKNLSKARNSITSCAAIYTKKHNPEAKFMSLTIENGIRVWRIK